MMKEDNLINQN